MKLSNITNFTRHGRNELDWRFTADVDVTTGILWWKKTQTRPVGRSFGFRWFFLDNGQHTPGFQMQDLAKPDEFKNGW